MNKIKQRFKPIFSRRKCFETKIMRARCMCFLLILNSYFPRDSQLWRWLDYEFWPFQSHRYKTVTRKRYNTSGCKSVGPKSWPLCALTKVQQRRQCNRYRHSPYSDRKLIYDYTRRESSVSFSTTINLTYPLMISFWGKSTAASKWENVIINHRLHACS